MLRYTHLLCDADDTVLDFVRAEEDTLNQALTLSGITPNKGVTAAYSAINESMWNRLQRGEITREQLKLMRFKELVQRCGLNAAPEELAVNYISCLAECGYFLPGAEDFLQKLKALNVSVAIVTNGAERVQKGRARRCGLMRFAKALVISEEYGYSKPDVRLAHEALRQLDNPQLSGVLMLGDSASADIEMANRAGIDSCFFNPMGQTCAQATYCAKGYEDVLKIITGVSR